MCEAEATKAAAEDATVELAFLMKTEIQALQRNVQLFREAHRGVLLLHSETIRAAVAHCTSSEVFGEEDIHAAEQLQKQLNAVDGHAHAQLLPLLEEPPPPHGARTSLRSPLQAPPPPDWALTLGDCHMLHTMALCDLRASEVNRESIVQFVGDLRNLLREERDAAAQVEVARKALRRRRLQRIEDVIRASAQLESSLAEEEMVHQNLLSELGRHQRSYLREQQMVQKLNDTELSMVDLRQLQMALRSISDEQHALQMRIDDAKSALMQRLKPAVPNRESRAGLEADGIDELLVRSERLIRAQQAEAAALLSDGRGEGAGTPIERGRVATAATRSVEVFTERRARRPDQAIQSPQLSMRERGDLPGTTFKGSTARRRAQEGTVGGQRAAKNAPRSAMAGRSSKPSTDPTALKPKSLSQLWEQHRSLERQAFAGGPGTRGGARKLRAHATPSVASIEMVELSDGRSSDNERSGHNGRSMDPNPPLPAQLRICADAGEPRHQRTKGPPQLPAGRRRHPVTVTAADQSVSSSHGSAPQDASDSSSHCVVPAESGLPLGKGASLHRSEMQMKLGKAIVVAKINQILHSVRSSTTPGESTVHTDP